MKIEIFKEGKPIRIFHHSREVLYNAKHNTITIGKTEPETYHLLKKPTLEWLDKNSFIGETEILVRFEIKDSNFKVSEKYF